MKFHAGIYVYTHINIIMSLWLQYRRLLRVPRLTVTGGVWWLWSAPVYDQRLLTSSELLLVTWQAWVQIRQATRYGRFPDLRVNRKNRTFSEIMGPWTPPGLSLWPWCMDPHIKFGISRQPSLLTALVFRSKAKI